MKKIIATVVTSSIMLVGGSTAASATASTDLKKDKMFVSIISSRAPEFKGIARSTMVKTAKQTCKFLRAGFGPLEAVDLMIDNGFTEDGSMTFVAGAVVMYCPDQKDNLG